MVKISIKKDKKTKTKAKPKQKQKQKQSQKVIVNIGSNAVRTRRAPAQTLQKKAANNQTPTPNIIVPQAMPQNSNNEILRYIRESEQLREIIKKQEKSNELEKDKIKAKEKKTTIIPEEDAQSQFSSVNSQTISSLTSGSATPNPLSRPVNSRSLFDALIKIADIQGENPNSGVISLASSVVDNPLTFTTLATNNSSRLNVSSNTSLDSFFRENETGSLIQPEVVDVEPEFNTEIPIPVDIDPEPQEEFYDLPEDEEPPEEPPQEPPLVIEPTQPEAVILPIQPEAPLLYEEDQTAKPKI